MWVQRPNSRWGRKLKLVSECADHRRCCSRADMCCFTSPGSASEQSRTMPLIPLFNLGEGMIYSTWDFFQHFVFTANSFCSLVSKAKVPSHIFCISPKEISTSLQSSHHQLNWWTPLSESDQTEKVMWQSYQPPPFIYWRFIWAIATKYRLFTEFCNWHLSHTAQV